MSNKHLLKRRQEQSSDSISHNPSRRRLSLDEDDTNAAVLPSERVDGSELPDVPSLAPDTSLASLTNSDEGESYLLVIGEQASK